MQYYLENLDAIEMAMRVAGQHEFKRKTRAVRCGLIDDDYPNILNGKEKMLNV